MLLASPFHKTSTTARYARFGMEELGVNEQTEITVLTDGDAGLRTVPWEVAPESQHILDWFHIGSILGTAE
jgi:hypothetical protein